MRCLILLTVFLFPLFSEASCLVYTSMNQPARGLGDVLFELLSKTPSCPRDVHEFRRLLRSAGLTPRPSMVANRGRNNPHKGSFSLFERVLGQTSTGTTVSEGQFFFGHFTAAQGATLVLDQGTRQGTLMIELIVWDSRKGLFNFYELIGTGSSSRWFYRGDSADILADNSFLHLDPPSGQAQFGTRLRCSACHISGGPIMKELSAPHNDWWTNLRPLPLVHSPEPRLKSLIDELEDAEVFATAVRRGIEGLEASPRYQSIKQRQDLRARLRPLFCESEINLVSDIWPSQTGTPTVRVSSLIFASGRWGARDLHWPRPLYMRAMRILGLRFPESGHPDADHAALAPVKSLSDEIAIDSLIRSGLIDSSFAATILAFDLENPLISPSRCRLLKLVPRQGPSWISQFVERLTADPSPQVQELGNTLRRPSQSRHASTTQRVSAHLDRVQNLMNTPDGSVEVLSHLVRLRRAISLSEISRNPQGQILEPGFRIIWPEPSPLR